MFTKKGWSCVALIGNVQKMQVNFRLHITNEYNTTPGYL